MSRDKPVSMRVKKKESASEETFEEKSKPQKKAILQDQKERDIVEENYWYSVLDGFRLLMDIRTRRLTPTKYNPTHTERISAYTENQEGIFIADPYHVSNFDKSFSDDVNRLIHGRGHQKGWQLPESPKTIIIPLLAGGHWRSIRIEIDYSTGNASILWSDPFGKGGFSKALKDRLLPSIKKNIDKLLRHNNEEIGLDEIQQCEKEFDQQGRGLNGSDCGPITFQNIWDYTTPHLRNPNLAYGYKYYSIGDHRSKKHAQQMYEMRSLHIQVLRYYGERLDAGYSSFPKMEKSYMDKMRQDLLGDKLTGSNPESDIMERIAALDPLHIEYLFTVLDHERRKSGAYEEAELEEGYVRVAEMFSFNKAALYTPARQRRYDHMAYMVEGWDVCGSACFDGESLLIATNKRDKPADPEKLKKGKRYSLSFQEGSEDEKESSFVAEEKASEEPVVLSKHPLIKMVTAYLQTVTKYGKRMRDDKGSYDQLKAELNEILEGVIEKAVQYLPEESNQENFKTAIEKMTDSILASYLEPESGKALPRKLCEALERGKVKVLESGPDKLGRPVHAELRVLNDLITSGKFDKGGPFYIGISKKCCRTCENLIDAVNEVMGNKIEKVQVRDVGHGSYYPAAVPDFLDPEKSRLSPAIREQIELNFRKKMKAEPSEELGGIFGREAERVGSSEHAPRSPSPPFAFATSDIWSKRVGDEKSKESREQRKRKPSSSKDDSDVDKFKPKKGKKKQGQWRNLAREGAKEKDAQLDRR